MVCSKVALSVHTKHHTLTYFFHAKKIKSKGPKIATSATVVRLRAGHGRGENSPASESVVKELTEVPAVPEWPYFFSPLIEFIFLSF